jgi:hypothetical protein
MDCDAFEGGWVRKVEGRRFVILTLGPAVVGQADPSRVSVKRASWDSGMGHGLADAAHLEEGFADEGSERRMRINYTGEFPIADSTLELDGAIEVQGCGDRSKPTPARPQGELELQIGPDRFELDGARLTTERDGAQRLLLTSGALSCGDSELRHDLRVSVRFREGRAYQITLAGDRMISDLGNAGGNIEVRLDPSATAPDSTSATGTAEIDRNFPGDVRFRLQGRFDAERCPMEGG